LVGASDDVRRWLGWNVVQDGHLTLFPAETYGLLPPSAAPTPHSPGQNILKRPICQTARPTTRPRIVAWSSHDVSTQRGHPRDATCGPIAILW
jgi:hypothetical protein